MCSMAVRGIRGAITVDHNSAEDILADTKTLLQKMIDLNGIQVEDITSIFFSMTKDLNQTFPAKAARELGLNYTPLLCLNEVDVVHSIQSCIRIMIHVNSEKKQKNMQHIYLKEAVKLRPEFAQDQNI